jgi:hypothetical protein
MWCLQMFCGSTTQFQQMLCGKTTQFQQMLCGSRTVKKIWVTGKNSMPGIEILFLGCHKVQRTMNSQQASTPVIPVIAPNNRHYSSSAPSHYQPSTTISFLTHHTFVNIEKSQSAIDQNCLRNIWIHPCTILLSPHHHNHTLTHTTADTTDPPSRSVTNTCASLVQILPWRNEMSHMNVV